MSQLHRKVSVPCVHSPPDVHPCVWLTLTCPQAWLECTDRHHRYGKNLRVYYRAWEAANHPYDLFFDWLDSKGEAKGSKSPDLEECPRGKLDSDSVLYLTDMDEQNEYELTLALLPTLPYNPQLISSPVNSSPPVASPFPREMNKMSLEEGRFGDGTRGDNNVVFMTAHNVPVNTGPDGWIFVLRDGKMYVREPARERSERVSLTSERLRVLCTR